MNSLISYLLDNLLLDFSGDLSLDMVRDFLRKDDSPAAKALLDRLVAERGPQEMMLTLADCLKDYIRTGINEGVVREQLGMYLES